MPDILGNWDRRADDKDYNPVTKEIEPGYARKQHKLFLEQKKEERERLQELKKALASLNLTYNKLSKNNYELIATWGKHLSGQILSKQGDCVAEVGIKKRKPFLNLTYLGQFDKFNLRNIKETLEFKEFLNKNKIIYLEKQPKEEVLKQLEKYSIETDKLKEETSELIKIINT